MIIFHKLIRQTEAYAIALTLVAMPLVVGLAMLVIDGSRVVNLHTDLANAVDAMALAGARELDGRSDAIVRSNNAIATLVHNSATFSAGGPGAGLGSAIDVAYDPNDDAASTVIVRYLSEIPSSDDSAIEAGMITTDPAEAKYAWVISKPQAMNLLFPWRVASSTDVEEAAIAVYNAAACDVTPLWICNPFEPTDLNTAFANGDFYGRLLTMEIAGPSSALPGNFGFLAVGGTGGSVLGNALATSSPNACYSQNGVTTEPGATWGPVENGINTRMGLYGGNFNKFSSNAAYRPAQNVRKGAKTPNSCNKYTEVDPAADGYVAMAFPSGKGVDVTLGGGRYSASGDWDLDLYWDVNHSGQNPYPLATDPTYQPPAAPSIPFASYAGPLANRPPVPSRYDVYRYEIDNNMTPDAAPNGEVGTPMCGAAPSATGHDRRVIFAAVVNCNALAASGGVQGRSDLPTEGFVSMFMTKPATTDSTGADKILSMEIVDVTGDGGRGTMSEFLREEAELVRIGDTVVPVAN